MSRLARPPKPVPRLAPVAVTILESLYQHRLLSTLQLHDLHTPTTSLRWTQHVLKSLRQAELVAVTRKPGGLGLWYLTERGVLAVETIGNRAEPRRKLIRPEHAAGPLQAHTLAVNDVGIAFVKAAREHGHQCGPFAWRHEIAHPLGPPPGRRRSEQLIADAVLTYQLTAPDDSAHFHYRFLELDRATMQVEDLAAKLARYAQLYLHGRSTPKSSPEPTPLWRHSYPVFPSILVVLDGRVPLDALVRRRATVLALCQADDELRAAPEVEISVCLLNDLAQQGPFSSIFRTLADPHTPTDWLATTLTPPTADNLARSAARPFAS